MTAEELVPETETLQRHVAGKALAFGERAVALSGVEWTDFGPRGPGDVRPEELPGVEDGSVDTVVGVFALERCFDPYACLQQWSRVLREGGGLVLLLRVPSDPVADERHGFSPSYLVQLVNHVGGLLIREVAEVSPGKTWVVRAERNAVAGVRIPMGAIGPDLVARANQGAETKAELYFQFGTVLLQAGDPSLAETCYRHAMSLEGSNPEVLFGLGMSAAAQGRWSEALSVLQKVVALSPDNQEAQRWVALAKDRLAGAPA